MIRLLQTALVWLLCLSCALAQGLHHPAKWRTEVKDLGNGKYILGVNVQIQQGWHLYAIDQKYKEGEGPLAAKITFEESPATSKLFHFTGSLQASTPIEKRDDIFEVQVRYYENSAHFERTIERLNSNSFSIKLDVNYQVCSDNCINENESLTFNIPAATNSPSTASASHSAPNSTSPTSTTLNSNSSLTNHPTQSPFSTSNSTPKSTATATSNSTPTSATTSTPTSISTSNSTSTPPPNSPVTQNTSPSSASISAASPAVVASSNPIKSFNFWSIFLTGFIAGFAAIITPCVYSMVPLTVSFFTKQSKSRTRGIRNAFLYGLFIVLIYDLLTLLITIAFGAQALNGLASNVGVNIFFFAIFVLFAASFLGAFEINLPSSWINKADSASERGGLLGIFFMAFTLVLVSFSCTGPVVGGLLPLISNGTYLAPLVGMTGFGLCLALPFALFALFPGWLSSLPKSGGWLNSVKVVLGLLEFGLAMKFLSNADLVAGWHLVSRELFIAFWIVCFGVMGFYLLGKIKFSHDSDLPHISVIRSIFAIVVLTFTVYLLPGLFGAPLNLISGFPPPQSDGWSENTNMFGTQNGLGFTTNPSGNSINSNNVGNHTGNHFKDYDAALAYAKKEHKPLLLDFTGWTCVNCRKMEQNVWPKAEIAEMLSNDFVIASLYVDDKETGKKWSELEITRYQHNSQPFYVVLSNNEKVIGPAVGYSSVDEFTAFLKQAKQMFKDSMY